VALVNLLYFLMRTPFTDPTGGSSAYSKAFLSFSLIFFFLNLIVSPRPPIYLVPNLVSDAPLVFFLTEGCFQGARFLADEPFFPRSGHFY